MYALIRKISLEVGRRLAQRGILREAQDFFYLRYQDVINSLGCLQHDVASIRQRIEVNRNYMMSFRHFENPNEVGRRWQYAQKPAEPEPQGGVVYRGIPCAPGRVSGRVRIIRDINESHRLQRGDILVTRFTDPGWTPLFSLISGVITETGGILSHAAIIAREQGVPAVLSVQGATSRMRDDVRVVLDGNRGEVIPVC
jgi:phosphohistidine swiveling domain-containing protein